MLTRSPATLQDVERYARLANSLSLDTPIQPDITEFTKAVKNIQENIQQLATKPPTPPTILSTDRYDQGSDTYYRPATNFQRRNVAPRQSYPAQPFYPPRIPQSPPKVFRW